MPAMPAATVVVFGGGGQLGRELARATAPDGFQVRALAHAEADVTDPRAVRAAIAGARAAINAAAYTDVDRAESEPAPAFAVNQAGAGAVAEACAAARIPLVHVSTDYVFDGTANRPYREDDARAPLGVYGASKAAGEDAVRAAGGTAAILRTAWVFSPFGRNFVTTLLRLGAERDEVAVVCDQQGGPTAARDLAHAALTIAAGLAAGGKGTGTFHYCGAPPVSRSAFAQEIFAGAASRGLPAPQRLRAIATADHPTPARRPANSVLDCARIAAVWGLAQPDWRQGLAACLDRLAGT